MSHKNQIITLGKVRPKYYSYTKAFKIAHARLTCLCFDVAAVSFLLTKEWSKFASEVDARDLIGAIMRWVHESFFYPS